MKIQFKLINKQESLEIVLPVLKHALDLINDSKNDIKKDHIKIQSDTSLKCEHNHHHHHEHENKEMNQSNEN